MSKSGIPGSTLAWFESERAENDGTGREDEVRTRARALCGAGRLAWYQGDMDGAESYLYRALELAQGGGHEAEIVRALNARGLVYVVRGEWERARREFEEALFLSRQVNDEPGLLDALCNLGLIIADVTVTEENLSIFESGVALARQRGDRRALSLLLVNHGMLCCFDGRLKPALSSLQEGLRVTREVGETWNEARANWCLGHHALWLVPGLPDEAARREAAHRARRFLGETLRILRAVHSQWETPYVLEAFALIAIAEGDIERGAWLFGASGCLRDRLGSVAAPAARPHYERFVALARQLAGDEVYDAAHAKGCAHGARMQVEDGLTLLPES